MLCTGDLRRSCLTTRVDFRWYKDGALLTPGGRYRTLSEPRSGLQVLEIRAASKEDLGCYECEVRQEAAGEGWGACVKDPAISPPSMMHDERGDTKFRSPRVHDGTPKNCRPPPMMRGAPGPRSPTTHDEKTGLHKGALGGVWSVLHWTRWSPWWPGEDVCRLRLCIHHDAAAGHMGSGLHGRSQGSK